MCIRTPGRHRHRWRLLNAAHIHIHMNILLHVWHASTIMIHPSIWPQRCPICNLGHTKRSAAVHCTVPRSPSVRSIIKLARYVRWHVTISVDACMRCPCLGCHCVFMRFFFVVYIIRIVWRVWDFYSGWKPTIFEWKTMAIMCSFLLGDVTFGQSLL